MRKFTLILLLISGSIYSQTNDVFTLRNMELANFQINGIDSHINFMESLGFTIEDTNRENSYERAMADIIYFHKQTSTTVINYFNTQCYAPNACNVMDIYTSNKEVYDALYNEAASLSSDYLKRESRIDDEGITYIFIKGSENTYPYTIIEFTPYQKNGIRKYQISFQNNQNYITSLSERLFRRRYQDRE